MYKVSILWKELRDFLLLWLTQSLSGLGSAMTSYALIVWSYQQEGSALSTALLSICSYAPYVVMSIFAGALSDRWNKKRTLLWCDSFAAATTVAVLLMLRLGTLRLEYLYLINALNGLMNTIQQPAADVVNTLLTPKKHYQRVSGLRSLSSSAQSLLTPVLATALLAFAGLEAVLVVDLATFVLAFATLLGCIRIPPMPNEGARPEKVLLAARQGLRYLKGNPGILHLMLFLAAINLTASMYEAALPALLLNRGGEVALGMVSTGLRPRPCWLVPCWLPPACSPKQDSGDLQYAAAFHEHGKPASGGGTGLALLVRGGGAGLDWHSIDAGQPGCGNAQPYPSGNAGACMVSAEYLAIFYHSPGIFPGRMAGGPGL